MRRFLKASAQTVRGAQDKRTKEHFGAANRKCFVVIKIGFCALYGVRKMSFLWAELSAAEILNNRDNSTFIQMYK